jgi:hypothetical protein
MNASQFLAWILCLVLAFFASALAVRNGYKAALLEKEFQSVQKAMEDRGQVLEEIRDLLENIDRRLAAQAGVPIALERELSPADPEPAAALPSP